MIQMNDTIALLSISWILIWAVFFKIFLKLKRSSALVLGTLPLFMMIWISSLYYVIGNLINIVFPILVFFYFGFPVIALIIKKLKGHSPAPK